MKKKHLTYDDRLAIQAGLQQGLKAAQIARNIGKDRATIGREIKAHRRLVSTSNGNNCIHHKTCTRIPDCRSSCHRGKHQCQTACGRCHEGCPEYHEEFCSDYEKSPFVCNPCDHRLRCRLCRMLYDAKYAQEQYEKTLSESRRGISLTEQELNRINDTISPLLKKGQSLPTICERNHELIRYVIPKNQAKERYTKAEIREMMNHINSYPRKKWNGQAPIDLFVKIYGKEAAERLGLEKIPSDSIHLTPALFKK